MQIIIIMMGANFGPLTVVKILLYFNSKYFLLFPTEEIMFPRD